MATCLVVLRLLVILAAFTNSQADSHQTSTPIKITQKNTQLNLKCPKNISPPKKKLHIPYHQTSSDNLNENNTPRITE
jgi:hypothetical protein